MFSGSENLCYSIGWDALLIGIFEFTVDFTIDKKGKVSSGGRDFDNFDVLLEHYAKYACLENLRYREQCLPSEKKFLIFEHFEFQSVAYEKKLRKKFSLVEAIWPKARMLFISQKDLKSSLAGMPSDIQLKILEKIFD